MSVDGCKPVILLTFANDRLEGVGYLRNLPEEARRLRAAVEPAESAGLANWLSARTPQPPTSSTPSRTGATATG